MTEKENEFKLMLTANEYHMLLRTFDNIMMESGLQTNYYYDTRDEAMRKKNVTVRVRQKGERLIGTIKRHLDANGHSTEEFFRVDMLPRVIILDCVPVELKGALITERKICKVCDGITMMLDMNRYLDTVDYELEIEFSEALRQQAEGMLILIRSLLRRSLEIETASKSERFFRWLSISGGVANV